MCLPTKISGASIQQITILLGNLLCLNFGLIFGITPSHSALYQSPEGTTPLNRPVQRSSTVWLSSYLFLSAALGALLFGWLSRKIGPKSVLLLSGLLQVTAWFCIHFGYDILHIYSSRFFAGVAGGAAFAVLPLFIIDITESSLIGSRLIASADQWRALGILCGWWMGSHLKYDYIAIIGICISVLFTLTFAFVQESPYYYLRKNNEIFMEKSLRWFRGIRQLEDRENPEFLREVEEFKRQLPNNKKLDVVSEAPWVYKIKLLLYCSLLTVGVQCSGIYVMINYGLELLQLDFAGLIWAGIMLLAAVLAQYTSVKLKRKVTLLASSFVCGLVWFALIGVTEWKSLASTTKLALMIGLIAVIMFWVNVGLQPAANLAMCEILPNELRANIVGAANSISWLVLFALIQSYSPSSGTTVFAAIFGSCCWLLTLFVLFLLPETYGYCLEDIQRRMGFIANENVAKITTISNGRFHEQNYI